MKLTSRAYWETYYKRSSVDRSVIEHNCSRYNLYWDILINNLEHNRMNGRPSILEVGGYPGRFLAYLASKYDLIPTSLDFNSDRTKIDETMSLFGVSQYEVIQADFLTHKPNRQFDIVISNGFIEHFMDFDRVMDKHNAYLKKGGTMMIMIPNKRWLRKWYGVLVDPQNLRAHNLKCMRKDVFTSFARRNDLKLIKFSYFGGFAYAPHQNLNVFQKLIYHAFRQVFKRLNPLIEKYPTAFLSSSLIACYKK